MKKIIFLSLFIYCISLGFAQTPAGYRITPTRSDKPIVFAIAQLSADIEGYDGNEVIIENAVPTVKDLPQAANGLKQIPVPGQDKAAYFRPHIEDDSMAIRIFIAPNNAGPVHIKVPKNAVIRVTMMTYLKGIKLVVKDVNSVQVNAAVPLIELDGISDFSLSTGEGAAGKRVGDKVILSNIKWSDQPVTINGKARPRDYVVVSNSASIELAVPVNIKGDIHFSSRNGQVFSNLGISPVIASQQDVTIFEQYLPVKIFEQYAPHETQLKTIPLNGGGININVLTNYGNIYLKKQ